MARDLVGEADPAHPLLAGAELAEQPEAGQAGQALEHAAVGGRARCRCGSAATRMPAAAAGAVAASHATATSARNPVPGRAGLGELLVAAVAVEADGRAGHEHRRLGGRATRARRRAGSCPCVRLSRICRFCSSVQRFSAMPSPARCTTPSRPSRPAASMSPASMSQRTVPGPPSARTTRTDVCPSASSERDQRAPDQPARPGDGDAHAAVTVPAGASGPSQEDPVLDDFKKFLFRGNVDRPRRRRRSSAPRSPRS